MKRRDLLRRIAQAAKASGVDWGVAREGANHTVYSLGGQMVPIPRHTEIIDRMAEVIFKQCSDALGEGWWK